MRKAIGVDDKRGVSIAGANPLPPMRKGELMTDNTIRAYGAEVGFREAMFQAETEGKYEDAALAALGLAEMVSFRSPEGAMYCAQRAQVYATLHQARHAESTATEQE